MPIGTGAENTAPDHLGSIGSAAFSRAVASPWILDTEHMGLDPKSDGPKRAAETGVGQSSIEATGTASRKKESERGSSP